jgi:UDP-MurNAc hydroxylase
MHGWRWRLADGKCLTSVGHDLRSAPLGEERSTLEPGRHPAAS